MTRGGPLIRRVLGRKIALVAVTLLVVARVSISQAEDLTLLGGDLSSDLPGRHAIQAGAPNVTDPDRILAQASGFPLFHRKTTIRQGLGPLFNNTSCGGCHVNNGRGPARFSPSNTAGSSMVLKVQARALASDGSPQSVAGLGGQVLDHATVPRRVARVNVRWQYQSGRYDDDHRLPIERKAEA